MDTEKQKQLDVDLLIAKDALDDAIHAITSCLDFEFENEFMPEFEKLCDAHIRYQARRQRAEIHRFGSAEAWSKHLLDLREEIKKRA